MMKILKAPDVWKKEERGLAPAEEEEFSKIEHAWTNVIIEKK